jgi:hypothetical protein
MTAQPDKPAGIAEDEVIHSKDLEDAETAAALEEYRAWSAAGRPALSHMPKHGGC